MVNTYIDPVAYKRAPTGQETATLIGNLCLLSAPVLVGATSLPITPNAVVAQSVGDIVTIFDFGNTEEVTITSPVSPGESSLPVSATQFAHAQYIVICTDGKFGSLAQTIVDACQELEDICRQPLVFGTYTDTHDLQSMRASITQDGEMVLRPYVAPVQSITSVAVTYTWFSASPVQYDSGTAKITNAGKLIELLGLSVSGNEQGYPVYPVLPAYNGDSPTGTVQLVYTAGFTQATLPGPLRQAAILLTSDLLSRRLNPAGFPISAMGKVHIESVLRGDTTGESLLYKQAVKKAGPYIQKMF